MNPCICGHTQAQHGSRADHKCLACIKCDQTGLPLTEPHVAIRCACNEYREQRAETA